MLLGDHLTNLVCAFAYNATIKETERSLDVILELKKNYLHPYVKSTKVPDYTNVTDGWYYDRAEMRPGLLAPFCMDVTRSISPFEHFFVWFAFSDLWNIPKISQVIFDMDWRKAGWIRLQRPPVVSVVGCYHYQRDTVLQQHVDKDSIEYAQEVPDRH